MPLQPKITGDNITDQWMEEVTYELNNVEARAAAIAAETAVDTAAGTEIIPIYADDASGVNQSTAVGDKQFVYYLTVTIGEEPELPLVGVTFIQFRGAQSRTVEISVKRIPALFENLDGLFRDYTVWSQLVTDWSTGAVEVDAFEDDPDGLDFGYRTEVKCLYARVREASDTDDPDSGYADRLQTRAYDYQWSRNGEPLDPFITDVTTTFPFIFINEEDVYISDTMAEDGIAAQFFCNISQA